MPQIAVDVADKKDVKISKWKAVKIKKPSLVNY